MMARGPHEKRMDATRIKRMRQALSPQTKKRRFCPLFHSIRYESGLGPWREFAPSGPRNNHLKGGWRFSGRSSKKSLKCSSGRTSAHNSGKSSTKFQVLAYGATAPESSQSCVGSVGGDGSAHVLRRHMARDECAAPAPRGVAAGADWRFEEPHLRARSKLLE